MALEYPTDIWREILLNLDSVSDLLSVAQSHPSFLYLLSDSSFLHLWLNLATPKVMHEFGAIGHQNYMYGDWMIKYVMPRHENPTARFKLEFLLGRGCSADVIRNGKVVRCGFKAGYSSRDEHTFSFDLLKLEGWKICKQCLSQQVIFLHDTDSMIFLDTFTKIFTSSAADFPEPQSRVFQHLGNQFAYLKLADIDSFIRDRSAGLFQSFAIWKSGVLAKRGSTSELTIRALQHGARGFLELPAGPIRTQIAMEIADQQIREYQHNMLKFEHRQHPDLARVRRHL